VLTIFNILNTTGNIFRVIVTINAVFLRNLSEDVSHEMNLTPLSWRT